MTSEDNWRWAWVRTNASLCDAWRIHAPITELSSDREAALRLGREVAVIRVVEILERSAREAAEKEAAATNETDVAYYHAVVESYREAARMVRQA